jgi:hypothetical protein
MGGRAPRRSGTGGGRIGRRRAAVRDRSHPRRGQARLAHRAQRPRHPRLRRRARLRPADVGQGHQPRHHTGALRRPEQLVGRVRPVGVLPFRAPRRAPDGRRPGQVDRRGPSAQHRGAQAPADRLSRRRSRRHPDPRVPEPGPGPSGPADDRRAVAGGVQRRAAAHAGLPAGRRPARRPHPWREECAVGPGRRRGCHLPPPRRAGGHLPRRGRAAPRRRRGGLLPHRRAVQPHLVRAHHLLGFPHVRNYDGSWTEWGNTVRVPITRGDSP